MNQKNKIAHIVTALCLLAAGALLCLLFVNIYKSFKFRGMPRQATRLEFDIDDPAKTGFMRDALLYTEDGITSAAFSGKITVDGTAQIIVAARESGSIVYSKTYQNEKEEPIDFVLEKLSPYTYYTISFSSSEAKKGHLLLTTSESFAERPERPSHPEYTSKPK